MERQALEEEAIAIAELQEDEESFAVGAMPEPGQYRYEPFDQEEVLSRPHQPRFFQEPKNLKDFSWVAEDESFQVDGITNLTNHLGAFSRSSPSCAVQDCFSILTCGQVQELSLRRRRHHSTRKRNFSGIDRDGGLGHASQPNRQGRSTLHRRRTALSVNGRLCDCSVCSFGNWIALKCTTVLRNWSFAFTTKGT